MWRDAACPSNGVDIVTIRTSIFAGLCAAILSTTAIAQTVPAQNPSQAAQPQLPEPSAQATALARELIVAAGISRTFDGLIPQLMIEIQQSILQVRPQIVKELDDVLVQLKPEFDGQRAEMITLAAKIYARALSEADMKDALTYFKSAAGQRYVAAQPVMLDQLFNEMQAASQKIGEQLMKRVREELKKRKIDI
jgi:hypothetical protein